MSYKTRRSTILPPFRGRRCPYNGCSGLLTVRPLWVSKDQKLMAFRCKRYHTSSYPEWHRYNVFLIRFEEGEI